MRVPQPLLIGILGMDETSRKFPTTKGQLGRDINSSFWVSFFSILVRISSPVDAVPPTKNRGRLRGLTVRHHMPREL